MNLFNTALEEISDPKIPRTAGHLISVCLLAACNNLDMEIDVCPLKPENFVEVAKMTLENRASREMTVNILEKAIAEPTKSVEEIVEIYGLKQISDPKEIEKICLKVMEDDPKLVRRYRNGKEKEFNRLFRRVVKESNETVHTMRASEILKKLLNENKNNDSS